MESKDAKAMKVVYTVVERGGKSYWVRIGIGGVNKDGSLNLKLDAVPVNGTLQVRDWEPKDDRRTESGGAPHAGNGALGRDAHGANGALA
jgi:hypothetical protein